MERITLITILTVISMTAFGQQYQKSVKEISDQSAVRLLSSIDTSFIRKSDRFIIKFFRVSNGSGSANLTGGDEITKNILISVAEYDENPQNKVFSVGPFYMPNFTGKGIDLKDRYIITLDHGEAGKRQETKLVVYLDRVVLE